MLCLPLFTLNSVNVPTGYFSTSLITGWNHLVVASSSSGTKFYVNGLSVSDLSQSINLRIETIGNLIGGNGKFATKMDDFRVYDRTLTQIDVSNLYGNGSGDFGVHAYQDNPPSFDNVPEIIPPKSPLVYWTFNELNGTSVRDDSGFNNDGQFADSSNAADLFAHSEAGRNGTALRFDGNETLSLLQGPSLF